MHPARSVLKLKGKLKPMLKVRMDLFDRILLLDQRRLVEQGTHMRLLDRRGIYANLYRTAVASPTLQSRRHHRLAPAIHF